MKFKIILVLLLAVAAQDVNARQLKNIKDYCIIVEGHIVILAEMVISSNDEMAKHAINQPTADNVKFNEAQGKLENFSVSLKKSEEEWSRLNCAHILYPPPK